MIKKNNNITIKTQQGIYTLPGYVLKVGDPISTCLYYHGNFEMDLMRHTMSKIRSINGLPKGKGTILDIGGNNGVTSIGMIVDGLLDKAISIEPEPRNFSLLKHNVKQNNLENKITCINYAISSEKSTLEFELSKTNFGDHRVRKPLHEKKIKDADDELKREIIHVKSITLNDLWKSLGENICKDIAVIWIDVQGHEGHVFRGGRKDVFLKDIPVVSEICPYLIFQSGMSKEEFCNIVMELWPYFWIPEKTKLVKKTTDTLHTLFDAFDYKNINMNNIYHENVMFTK